MFPSIWAGTGYVGNATLTPRFQDFWIAFATKLDPTRTPADPLVWPQYNGGHQMMVFADNGSYVQTDDYRAARLSYIADNILSSSETSTPAADNSTAKAFSSFPAFDELID